MDTTREAYQQKMEAQLKEWGAKIDLLKAKAEKAGADVKVSLHEHLDELHDLEKAARVQVEKIKVATAETFSEVKGEAEVAWKRITAGVESLWKKVS
jgi:hypothetical protein